MIHFDRYGLHRIEGDIALLVQQGSVDHALGIGMEFKVRVRKTRACTHKIDLTAAEDHDILHRFRDDPLFRAMLPVPRDEYERPIFLEDTVENKMLVQRLGDLSSPGSFSILFPFWMARPEKLFLILQETNVQPLALHSPRIEHSVQISRILDAALHSNRRLILLGSPYTPLGSKAERVVSDVTLDDLDGINLEAAGAWALKQHMLGRT